MGGRRLSAYGIVNLPLHRPGARRTNVSRVGYAARRGVQNRTAVAVRRSHRAVYPGMPPLKPLGCSDILLCNGADRCPWPQMQPLTGWVIIPEYRGGLYEAHSNAWAPCRFVLACRLWT